MPNIALFKDIEPCGRGMALVKEDKNLQNKERKQYSSSISNRLIRSTDDRCNVKFSTADVAYLL